jgi:amidophosphoribosyltransferase
MAPCFYGIDMPTVGELFAPAFLNGKGRGGGKSSNSRGGKPPNGKGEKVPNGRGQFIDPSPEALRKMADELGADSLGYLSQERLIKAVGLPRDHLCSACLDTRYPTPAGEARYQESLAAW